MFHHVKELQFNARVSKPDPRFARLLLEQFGDYKSWAYAYPWSDILYTKSIDELTPEETQQIKP